MPAMQKTRGMVEAFPAYGADLPTPNGCVVIAWRIERGSAV
jgi:hypothetical protein